VRFHVLAILNKALVALSLTNALKKIVRSALTDAAMGDTPPAANEVKDR
jgi:hypothetical protein